MLLRVIFISIKVKFLFLFCSIVKPFSTLANGNCLYNACSIALIGDEHLSPYLRCLTSIEMYENAVYYANHPLIQSQHENGAFTSLKNAFAMCLSDDALSCCEKNGHIAAVVEEAKRNANNYKWSSMMCMFALSTAIHCIIQSYYPIKNDSAAKEDWDSLEKMFNCSIKPRQPFDDSSIKNVHIFRCAAIPVRYLVDRKIPETKNHFVALCQPMKNVEPGEHYFVPKLPQSVKTTIDPTALTKMPKQTTVTPSTISKQQCPSIGKKRRQLRLDVLAS